MVPHAYGVYRKECGLMMFGFKGAKPADGFYSMQSRPGSDSAWSFDKAKMHFFRFLPYKLRRFQYIMKAANLQAAILSLIQRQ